MSSIESATQVKLASVKLAAPYPLDYLINDSSVCGLCEPNTVQVLENKDDECLIIATITGNTYADVTYFSFKEAVYNDMAVWAQVAKGNSDNTVELHFTSYNPNGQNPFNLSPESYIVPLLTVKLLQENEHLRTAIESKYVIIE